MARRLLVLGIDAASSDLVSRWAREGHLPTLGRLMEQGISGRVSGVDGFFIGSTWPSLYTGLNPAGHGFYRIDQLKNGTYQFFRPHDEDGGIGGKPFWSRVSEAGKTATVLDVPLSLIDPKLAGLQVVEWGGHDSVNGFQASSSDLEQHILNRIGPYPMPSSCDGHRETAADFCSFIDGLCAAITKKADLTIDLLKRPASDLFVQVFTEAHCAGHQCWHLHDPTHPAHDAEIAAQTGDPLLRVYQAVDEALGRILEFAPDHDVLVFSAHGMGPFRGGHMLLQPILHELGVTLPPAAPDSGPGAFAAILRNRARAVWHKTPAGLRQLVKASLRRAPVHRRSLAQHGIRADFQRSRCFPVPNGFPISALRLNLQGRDPSGVLTDGPESETFCRQLAEDLLSLVNPDTGERIVQEVIRTAELYAGPRLQALPDLLIAWSDRALGTRTLADGRGATVRARSEKIGTIERQNSFGRSGEHMKDGFYTFRAAGRNCGAEQQSISIYDIAPTICELLGVSCLDTDGRAVPEILQLKV